MKTIQHLAKLKEVPKHFIVNRHTGTVSKIEQDPDGSYHYNIWVKRKVPAGESVSSQHKIIDNVTEKVVASTSVSNVNAHQYDLDDLF